MNLATLELTSRAAWALAQFDALAQRGREAGWLAADSLPQPRQACPDSGPSLDATPMKLLETRLALSPVEMNVLWLLVCTELDAQVLVAAQTFVSEGTNALSQHTVEQLVNDGIPLGDDVFDRLDRLALIETSRDPRLSLHRRFVRASDAVIALARGVVRLDRALDDVARLTTPLEARQATKDMNVTVPEAIHEALASALDVLLVVSGPEGSGRATTITHAIGRCGRSIIAVQTQRLAHEESALRRQVRALTRECFLHDAWPLFMNVDAAGDRRHLIERELMPWSGLPVFMTAIESSISSDLRSTVVVPVAPQDHTSRQHIWKRGLPDAADAVVAECARRYCVTPAQIMKAAATVTAGKTGGDIEIEHVQLALRSQLERQLAGLARRIETTQTWNDLVLPIDEFDLLVEMVARVKHREEVLDGWGFAEKVGRGVGVATLLSGPPGTGKTMIAGLIARELGLDLYQVDLSKVVSKYIGETEKQLAALFDAAESGHAIVLFDEADSLFAKRTEVKSSNDRYANLEVNYLLQRLEAFSGIAMLTTNHETAIDKAFLRRLAFHVRLPMPDDGQREQLWQTMLPAKAQRADDLDFRGLARDFVMSGGYIKNAMLRAAFIAANDRSPITNAHLWRAAHAEYKAMGKLAVDR